MMSIGICDDFEKINLFSGWFHDQNERGLMGIVMIYGEFEDI